MRRWGLKDLVMVGVLLLVFSTAIAGPYPPAAGQPGSTAVAMDDPDLAAWTSGWTDVEYGTDVDGTWRMPEKALGPATGDALDVVSLGRGGRITLTFAVPFGNGPGWDLAVFENAINDTFLELAFVEVSSNGSDFVRFPGISLTPAPVSAYGSLDPTDIDGLAGKYRKGYGTPFDLEALAAMSAVADGTLDLSAVTHVRIVDIVGDGTVLDCLGSAVYDPYPTTGSAGFDLEAIGVRYPQEVDNLPPEPPQAIAPDDFAANLALTPVLVLGPFYDLDAGDRHGGTRWQIAADEAFGVSDRRFQITGTRRLGELPVPPALLDPATNYYWRAAFLDSRGGVSDGSDIRRFSTIDTPLPEPPAMDWDADGDPDPTVVTIWTTDSAGAERQIGVEVGDNVSAIRRVMAVDLENTDSEGRPAVISSGVIAFRFDVADRSKPATVVVFLSHAVPSVHTWYFQHPDSGWDVAEAAAFNADRNRVILTIQDGSAADLDGVENGVILSVGAAGGRRWSDPVDEAAGIEGQGGCFIATLQASQPATQRLVGALGLLLLPFFGWMARNDMTSSPQASGPIVVRDDGDPARF
jgi:hypothetical protein